MRGQARGFMVVFVLVGMVAVLGFCITAVSFLGWAHEAKRMSVRVSESHQQLMQVVLQHERLIKDHYDFFLSSSLTEKSFIGCQAHQDSFFKVSAARLCGSTLDTEGFFCESTRGPLCCRWYISKNKEKGGYVSFGHTFSSL